MAKKTEQFSVRADPGFMDYLDRARGKISRGDFVRDIVNMQLGSSLAVTAYVLDKSIVVDLTKKLCGELAAEQLAEAIGSRDQRYLLRSILQSLSDESEPGLFREGTVDYRFKERDGETEENRFETLHVAEPEPEIDYTAIKEKARKKPADSQENQEAG